MQAAKRKRTRYDEPPFPVDDEGMQDWLCEQERELVVYLNPKAFVDFLWHLWLFAQEEDPIHYGDELSIWYHGGPPAGIGGTGFGICQFKLVPDSHAQTKRYKEGGGKLCVQPTRFDLYVTRADFKRAFLDAKAIGRRRRGKTVSRVKLFDTFWLERLPDEYWPAKG